MPTDERQPFRILIIEDDDAIGSLVVHYLGSMGFDTCRARNGAEGLELFRAWNPHLILLDLSMPGMDGAAVLKEIRVGSTVPVIVLTALEEESNGLQLFRNGADDFVVKPFSPALLLARVVAHLRRCYAYDAKKMVPKKAAADPEGPRRLSELH